VRIARRMRPLVGCGTIILLAWLMSENRRAIRWRLVFAGLALQVGVAVVLLKVPVMQQLFAVLTASLISAPACIVIAQMMMPMTEPPLDAVLERDGQAQGAIDALVRGTTDGIDMVLNITAIIIVLFAVIYIINAALGILPLIGGEAVTIQRLASYVFAPLCWLIGIPWHEALIAGELMGTKTILNEFVAYLALGTMGDGVLSAQTRIILTYALCGFANFGSLGILAGGVGAMVPERRLEIIQLGLRAIIAGTLATMMTGAVVALILIIPVTYGIW
jgi:concentrative nucleoside transporter, CNT family